MYKVNISIDDVSPHPDSSTKVLDRCFEILKEIPAAKFTLFIPLAYWRTIGATATTEPLFINNFPEFLKTIKNLPKENFEIGIHGLFHGVVGQSNNDEFKNPSKKRLNKILDVMYCEIKKSEIHFKNILRPPAWKISDETIREIKSRKPKTIFALHPEYPVEVDKVVWCNVNPPFMPLKLEEKTEIVYHACEWDENYLSNKKTEELISFLKQDKIKFTFMEGLL